MSEPTTNPCESDPRTEEIRARLAALHHDEAEFGGATAEDRFTRAAVGRMFDSDAPADLAYLLGRIEALEQSDREARAERDSIVRRIGRLESDESWWIGGAWGDYGEAVIPLRALSTLTGPLADADPKWETTPGFAATYGDVCAERDRYRAVVDAARAVSGALVIAMNGDSDQKLDALTAALTALDGSEGE